MEHVPEDISKSFGDEKKAIDEMEKGADKHYLRIIEGGNEGKAGVDGTFGIACINFDLKCLTERRMYIRHFSIRDKSRFEESFKMVVDFIWRTFDCDTIRLDLYHFYKTINGKEEQSADAEIKTIVAMNKKGFKWKTLQNEASGIRFQIMQMNRPAEIAKVVVQRDEPVRATGTQLYILSQEESYLDESFDQPTTSEASKTLGNNGLSRVEIPFCFYASLRHIQEKKDLTDLLKLNPSNILAAQIDNFTEEVGLNFVRTAFSQKYKDALEESKKPEGIEISVPLEH